ncbi:MAG TPA: zinc dependent phospholipase C family protein [Phycisphaerae bacterium]|nr:zinc dependent phospholipase C family protein [Phycisphaerae bacterium]
MSFRNLAPAIVAALIYTLLDTDSASAWGPGVHVALGTQILEQAALLPAAIAGLITRFAGDYLYGTLAADVVFAKRLSAIKQFCHHWSTGFAVLDRASTDRGRAFAYGYLSHLAADTVAHGKYVPYQLAVTRSTVNFGHVYWELRADATVEPEAWNRVRAISAGSYGDHHGVLAGVLTRTFLPFDANQELFFRINRLCGRSSWQRTMAVWERCSRYPLSPALLARYHSECIDRTICLLTSMRRSPLLLEDPNGTAALAYIRAHRREMRRLKRRGLPRRQRIRETAASHAPAIWPTTHTLPLAG